MRQGIEKGLWVSYYESGKVYSAGKYLNGLKDGLWRYYNERGVLTAEGEFRLGLEDGQWFRYHDTGSTRVGRIVCDGGRRWQMGPFLRQWATNTG